jgi:hypothetical protein
VNTAIFTPEGEGGQTQTRCCHRFHTDMLLPAAPATALCLTLCQVAPRGTLRGSIAMQFGEPPKVVLIWSASTPFRYEALGGFVEWCETGRSAQRLSTLAQAHSLGKLLLKAEPSVTYSIYKLGDGEMSLQGSYPKKVNAEGARIKFRRRKPRLGGADDQQLGVGGMGDDVWRELMQRDAQGDIDDAWSKFRRELELGRGLDVVDENGDPIDVGGIDYDGEEDVYD